MTAFVLHCPLGLPPLTLRLAVVLPSSLTFTRIGAGHARSALSTNHSLISPLSFAYGPSGALSLSPIISYSVTRHHHRTIASY